MMALLSEWICIRREMQEIPLSETRRRHPNRLSDDPSYVLGTFRYRNASPLQGTWLQEITTHSR